MQIYLNPVRKIQQTQNLKYIPFKASKDIVSFEDKDIIVKQDGYEKETYGFIAEVLNLSFKNNMEIPFEKLGDLLDEDTKIIFLEDDNFHNHAGAYTKQEVEFYTRENKVVDAKVIGIELELRNSEQENFDIIIHQLAHEYTHILQMKDNKEKLVLPLILKLKKLDLNDIDIVRDIENISKYEILMMQVELKTILIQKYLKSKDYDLIYNQKPIKNPKEELIKAFKAKDENDLNKKLSKQINNFINISTIKIITKNKKLQKEFIKNPIKTYKLIQSLSKDNFKTTLIFEYQAHKNSFEISKTLNEIEGFIESDIVIELYKKLTTLI